MVYWYIIYPSYIIYKYRIFYFYKKLKFCYINLDLVIFINTSILMINDIIYTLGLIVHATSDWKFGVATTTALGMELHWT